MAHSPAHTGKVVSVSPGSLVMSHDDGSPNDTHTVAPGAVITLNGQAATLDQLRPGDAAVVSGSPATSVVATR